jgi:hypothetical protein
MSARYDSPSASSAPSAAPNGPAAPADVDDETARARADAALWRALDEGDDPTAHTDRSH